MSYLTILRISTQPKSKKRGVLFSANNKILLLALTFNSVLPILMPIIELKTIASLVLCLATFALNNLLLLLRQFITSL